MQLLKSLQHHNISNFKQETLPHPEYPDHDLIQVTFFTPDLTLIDDLIKTVIKQLNHDYDFEITPNIFYNCDDQNFLITLKIISYL